MKGLIIAAAFLGLLALLDKFKDNEKFNKASNVLAYVLLIGWFVLMALAAVFWLIPIIGRAING